MQTAIAVDARGGLPRRPHDSYEITGCRTLRVHRSYFRNSRAPTQCDVELTEGGAGPGLTEIQAALADPDVARAIAAAPVLYGSETNARDMNVISLTVRERVIRVGNACRSNFDGPSCRAIPAGVSRLVGLLYQIGAREAQSGACVAALEPGSGG